MSNESDNMVSLDIDQGIVVNAVYSSESDRMAVEIKAAGVSYIITRDVAEALACDLMEAAGYCEAYENGDEEELHRIENEVQASGGFVHGKDGEPIDDTTVVEYNTVEELITDMEQQAPASPKKTLH